MLQETGKKKKKRGTCCFQDCISLIVCSDLLESQSGNLFASLSPRAAPGSLRIGQNGVFLLFVSFLITF